MNLKRYKSINSAELHDQAQLAGFTNGMGTFLNLKLGIDVISMTLGELVI